MSESTDLRGLSRRELDEMLAALRQPPRADELGGETEAVASMVSAFGSSTGDRAPGEQWNPRLYLAAVAAGLVFVVAGAAAAAPHFLKTADTRSIVPSATSTFAVAQSGAIGPPTTSEEMAETSSSVDDEASSPPTTTADAPVAEPATTQPDGAVVRCVDRGPDISTTSTVHLRSPAGSPSTPSAPTTTPPLCVRPVDGDQSTVASSATSPTQDSRRPSNTAPGRVGQPGPGPASPANTAPGRLDRPASDEAPAGERRNGPQQSDPEAEDAHAEDDDDSEPGEDDSDEGQDD